MADVRAGILVLFYYDTDDKCSHFYVQKVHGFHGLKLGHAPLLEVIRFHHSACKLL